MPLLEAVTRIRPSLICDDPFVIEQIIASLSIKEMSQQALIRKPARLKTPKTLA
ncbi:hypothetical protein [Paraburkholderia humisilvae]|uniref:hypothetical protein n=1 Tax=Paraburkholderia humisilvae TaxID=627669 RepID=UPI001581BC27|nr:hypothetical protein [Paraburkholderia humisilvae]